MHKLNLRHLDITFTEAIGLWYPQTLLRASSAQCISTLHFLELELVSIYAGCLDTAAASYRTHINGHWIK
jgi:hypothetical protein